jgi:putative PIN family toxin of toxin-antitoxin system
MRIVLDTNIVVAALRSDAGASRQLLERALDQRFVLLLSVPLMIEYEDVLVRPEHLEVANLSAREVGIILDALARVGEAVRLSFLWRPMLKDPADEMVLETAVNGRADLLVTFNHRHFARAARLFEMKITTPGDALRLLEPKHEKK